MNGWASLSLRFILRLKIQTLFTRDCIFRRQETTRQSLQHPTVGQAKFEVAVTLVGGPGATLVSHVVVVFASFLSFFVVLRVKPRTLYFLSLPAFFLYFFFSSPPPPYSAEMSWEEEGSIITQRAPEASGWCSELTCRMAESVCCSGPLGRQWDPSRFPNTSQACPRWPALPLLLIGQCL